MTREEVEFLAYNEMFTGFKDKLLDHDASQRVIIRDQSKQITLFREALSELYAQVQGECPSLLNEDSGGDAKLALEIDALLQAKLGT